MKYAKSGSAALMGDPDSKIHGANMEPTWVLSAPDGSILAPRILLSGELGKRSQK